jgi:site-specific DNA-methyltransferase (adenine-specific)
MAVRLMELHRVLKPTGSIYLHCDPTASHYLKVLMDSVFGKEQFGNEIIWKRQNAKGLAFTRFARNHDVILRYSKSNQWVWNAQYTPHDPEYIRQFYKFKEGDGRVYRLADLTNPNKDRPNLTYEFLGVTRVWRWTKERMEEAYAQGLVIQTKPGAVPQLKRYLDEQEGTPVDDVWNDISLKSQSEERLGYPTQKPVALLERVLSASSNPGDIVLDPFCGCGTTVHAAEKLGRQWIGIDVTHLSISLIEKRLKDAFPGIKFEVHGAPKDLDGARDLSNRDKYQFQWWAVSLVDAVPFGGKKKGADGGIDGHIFFRSGAKTVEKAIVSVKGGGVGVKDIRELIAVVDRERAKIGVYISLEPHTEPMKKEAAAAGLYDGPTGKVPKIQLFTIEELFAGKKPKIPLMERGFKAAAREERDEQSDLDF